MKRPSDTGTRARPILSAGSVSLVARTSSSVGLMASEACVRACRLLCESVPVTELSPSADGQPARRRGRPNGLFSFHSRGRRGPRCPAVAAAAAAAAVKIRLPRGLRRRRWRNKTENSTAPPAVSAIVARSRRHERSSILGTVQPRVCKDLSTDGRRQNVVTLSPPPNHRLRLAYRPPRNDGDDVLPWSIDRYTFHTTVIKTTRRLTRMRP